MKEEKKHGQISSSTWVLSCSEFSSAVSFHEVKLFSVEFRDMLKSLFSTSSFLFYCDVSSKSRLSSVFSCNVSFRSRSSLVFSADYNLKLFRAKFWDVVSSLLPTSSCLFLFGSVFQEQAQLCLFLQYFLQDQAQLCLFRRKQPDVVQCQI